MHETEQSAEQKTVLKHFSDAGGVVDFAFFDCTEKTENVQSESTHREAVVAAMFVLQQRYGAYTKFTSLNPRIWKEAVWRIQVDSSRSGNLQGKRISKMEFLGNGCDHERGGLVGEWGSSWLNEFSGFAYAFASTPHPLRVKGQQLNDLFEQVKSFVLGGVTDESIIYAWPTDWSSYFDAGHEWWGSFLWSLGHLTTGRIVVIAASTTD